MASSTNPPAPIHAAWARPDGTLVPDRMAGNTNTGSTNTVPVVSSDSAVIDVPAVAALMPATVSIRNCIAAPAAWPPGTIRVSDPLAS